MVDDTPQIRFLLRINLELEGHVVEEAADGAACLVRLRDTTLEPFDVVLLDAEMHPLDGWATTAEIRRDAALAALPVLMVSASVQAHHRARARQVGVEVFIPKPFEPSVVVEVVERLASGMHLGSPAPDRPRS